MNRGDVLRLRFLVPTNTGFCHRTHLILYHTLLLSLHGSVAELALLLDRGIIADMNVLWR